LKKELFTAPPRAAAKLRGVRVQKSLSRSSTPPNCGPAPGPNEIPGLNTSKYRFPTTHFQKNTKIVISFDFTLFLALFDVKKKWVNMLRFQKKIYNSSSYHPNCPRKKFGDEIRKFLPPGPKIQTVAFKL